MTDQEQVQQLIRWQEAAIRAKDIGAAMQPYGATVLSFDVVDTLQKKGLDACRERLETWLAQFTGPFDYVVDELAIGTGGEVAFAHSLNHVSGTVGDGQPLDMRWRATVCFQKQGAQWVIVHEHVSVPFEAASGKALLSLRH